MYSDELCQMSMPLMSPSTTPNLHFRRLFSSLWICTTSPILTMVSPVVPLALWKSVSEVEYSCRQCCQKCCVSTATRIAFLHNCFSIAQIWQLTTFYFWVTEAGNSLTVKKLRWHVWFVIFKVRWKVGQGSIIQSCLHLYHDGLEGNQVDWSPS